jgi:hypothetical protein
MRDLSKNFDYRQDHIYAIYLLVVLMSLFSLNLVLEFFLGSLKLLSLIAFIPISFFLFQFYYHSLKNLLYTFWGLTLLLFPTLVYFFLESLSKETFFLHGTLTFLMVCIHLLVIYLASSPVYYPRVYWWEFDFRYRADIKCEIIFKGQVEQARLNDVRRGGGSLASFEEYDLGESINLSIDLNKKNYNFEVVIGSKSQSIPGRPFSYGVKFIDQNDKEIYQMFEQDWSHRSQFKINEKFKNGAKN